MRKIKIIAITLLIILLVGAFCACGSTRSGHTLTGKEFDGQGFGNSFEHDRLGNKMLNCHYTDGYKQLFILYSLVRTHAVTHGCDILDSWSYQYLLEEMLYGEWVDNKGVRRLKLYYNDKEYGRWLFYDLPDSDNPGEEYYYRLKIDEGALVVSYKNKATGVEVENCYIYFHYDYMELLNLIDGKTYILYREDIEEDKWDEDVETAFWHIVMNIYMFSCDPQSVEVNLCEVRGDEVYARITGKDANGLTVKNTYYLYKENGSYRFRIVDYYVRNNINVVELNQRLKDFLK